MVLGTLLTALELNACKAVAPTPDAPTSTTPTAMRPQLPPVGDVPSSTDSVPPTHANDGRRLIVFTLDGVRWQDIFPSIGGSRRPPAMPHLHRLIETGGIALGGPGCPYDVRVSGPSFVSLPGYFELFSGAPARDCLDNTCERIRVDTLLDAAKSVASSSNDVAVFASWSPYARAVAREPEGLTISAGRVLLQGPGASDPKVRALIEASAASPPYPGWGDYRPDARTAQTALRYLEVFRPHVLVVGLGDADEFAHRGDRSGYFRALRVADNVLQGVVEALDRLEPRIPTAVLVTTDHGRAGSFRSHGASFPESARVFLAAFGDGVAGRSFACASQPFRLADVAPVARILGGYPRAGDDAAPLAREMLGVSVPPAEDSSPLR